MSLLGSAMTIPRTPMVEGRVQGLAIDLLGEDRSGLLKHVFYTPSCHPVGYPSWGKFLCWASKRQVSHGRAAHKMLPSLFISPTNISQIHQPGNLQRQGNGTC